MSEKSYQCIERFKEAGGTVLGHSDGAKAIEEALEEYNQEHALYLIVAYPDKEWHTPTYAIIHGYAFRLEPVQTEDGEYVSAFASTT